MILISYPNPVWVWMVAGAEMRSADCVAMGRWSCDRLDVPTVNDLLEDRFETGEILWRTAQRDGVDKPVVALDQCDGLDGFGVAGFVV